MSMGFIWKRSATYQDVGGRIILIQL